MYIKCSLPVLSCSHFLCYLLHRLEQRLSIVLESHDQLQLGASRFHGWEETKWAVRSASKLNCLRHKHTCTNTWMHSKKTKTKHAQLFCYLPLWKNVILHECIIELSHLPANFLDTVNAVVPVRSWVWPSAKSGMKSICEKLWLVLDLTEGWTWNGQFIWMKKSDCVFSQHACNFRRTWCSENDKISVIEEKKPPQF